MTFLIMEDQHCSPYEQSGAYHLRMISYRSTLTNWTVLGRNVGDISAVHLHRDLVFLTGKFDPIRHRTDSPVNDLWVNLPVVNSWTSLPVIYVLPDRGDRRKGPDGTKVTDQIHGTGSDRTELGVNLQTSPPVTGLDRTGPNWVSISRRVHWSRDSQAIGQIYRSAQQHRRMGQRSSTEQPTTIRYMRYSSGRGPTVTSRNRYSTGPDQTNSSDYRKIGYITDNVPD